jgi:3-hexulose-6-phosphate synthase/6-phospho-3-hexuloisomerase
MPDSERVILQVALDFVDLDRALNVAQEAIAGGADWLEAGTPLIKSEGLDAVRALRQKFPDCTIVADMKIMDAGRIELEAAAKAGANIVDVHHCRMRRGGAQLRQQGRGRSHQLWRSR